MKKPTIRATAAYLLEEENNLIEDAKKFKLSIIERAEKFQSGLLETGLKHLDGLSDSIRLLANSVKEQKQPVVINLVIDKEIDPIRVQEIVNLIK